MLCFAARAVAGLGCDGTLRWAERFVEVRVPPATGAVRRLRSAGDCDCRLTTWGHELVRDQLLRDVHTDELVRPERLPPCAGVRRTSALPCRHWERVPAARRPGRHAPGETVGLPHQGGSPDRLT